MQSNTLCYSKEPQNTFNHRAHFKANNIPDDFKYLAIIESGLEK